VKNVKKIFEIANWYKLKPRKNLKYMKRPKTILFKVFRDNFLKFEFGFAYVSDNHRYLMTNEVDRAIKTLACSIPYILVWCIDKIVDYFHLCQQLKIIQRQVSNDYHKLVCIFGHAICLK